MLSSNPGQDIFEDLKASRPRSRPRTSKGVLEAKGILEDYTSACYMLQIVHLVAYLRPWHWRNWGGGASHPPVPSFFFNTLFPPSPLSFSLRPLDYHFFLFFALVYNASSIARDSLFRFACFRKHYTNVDHGDVNLIFYCGGWKSLIPHTGDRRFHATPSDIETRKKKEDSILRKFDSTKIQDVQQHER